MRTSRDGWAMEMAVVTAKRSTCLRRHVGCVLLNKRGHVLSTGYNGVAAGMPHCNERQLISADFQPSPKDSTTLIPQKVVEIYPHACEGAKAESGKDLDLCQAIHAEQNALLQCRDVWEIDTCYVTTSPCITCVKLLLNTSCRNIIYYEEYTHLEAKRLWIESRGYGAWKQQI